MTCAVCGFDPSTVTDTPLMRNYRWWHFRTDQLCLVCASWALRTLPFAA